MGGYQKKYLPIFFCVAVALGIYIGSQFNYSNNPTNILGGNSKKPFPAGLVKKQGFGVAIVLLRQMGNP